MGQILHKCAKTTQLIRAEIQRSKATIKELSQQYHLNSKTILKWKHRTAVEDRPMGPRNLRTVLSEKEQLMICAFRRKTLLSLDDCYDSLKPHITRLS